MSVKVELSRDPARRPGPHQACLPEEGGSPAPEASLCHGGWRLCHHHPGGSPPGLDHPAVEVLTL